MYNRTNVSFIYLFFLEGVVSVGANFCGIRSIKHKKQEGNIFTWRVLFLTYAELELFEKYNATADRDAFYPIQQ